MPQSACDRCRGQKLRCIRNHNSQSSCNRCEKAGVQCYVDPTVRMGRPLRDKNQPRELRKDQRRVSLLTASFDKSVISRDHETESDATHLIEGEENSTSNDFSATPFLPEYSLNFEEAITWEDGPRLFGSENNSDSNLDFTSNHRFPNPMHFEPYQLSPNAQNSSEFSPSRTTPGLEPNVEENGTAKRPEDMEVDSLHLMTSHQLYVEQLSKLNMELYQQATVTNATTDKCTLDGCGFYKPENEKNLSQLIGTMIQGLQTFHKLLRSIIISHATIDSKNTVSPNIPAMIQQPNSTAEYPGWQYPEISSVHHLNNTDGGSNIILADLSTNRQQEASLMDNASSNTFTAQSTKLNMPISLVVISCYINLVQFSCSVLVSIRCILTTRDSQWIFTALSSELQICGVSLKQDSELQILLLIQVVVRLLDQIEALLGCPFEKSQGHEDKRRTNVISPQLLNYLLEEQKRYGNGTIHTIREEIQKLNKAIYKHV